MIPEAKVKSFNKDHILAELKGSTAFQAIDELVGQLVVARAISHDAMEPIAAAVKERERSMSTGIGSGVAIPHATTPFVKEVSLAFGRSVRGIDFNALDQQPVRLVVLVIVPAGEREKHLPTIARLSRLFHRGEIRAALESAPDADEIERVLATNFPQ